MRFYNKNYLRRVCDIQVSLEDSLCIDILKAVGYPSGKNFVGFNINQSLANYLFLFLYFDSLLQEQWLCNTLENVIPVKTTKIVGFATLLLLLG